MGREIEFFNLGKNRKRILLHRKIFFYMGRELFYI